VVNTKFFSPFSIGLNSQGTTKHSNFFCPLDGGGHELHNAQNHVF